MGLGTFGPIELGKKLAGKAAGASPFVGELGEGLPNLAGHHAAGRVTAIMNADQVFGVLREMGRKTDQLGPFFGAQRTAGGRLRSWSCRILDLGARSLRTAGRISAILLFAANGAQRKNGNQHPNEALFHDGDA